LVESSEFEFSTSRLCETFFVLGSKCFGRIFLEFDEE
jgi:hypothetical protein